MTKEKILAKAQDAANREGAPMTVLNLNRVGAALYVVRNWRDGMETDRAFVAKVEPETHDEYGGTTGVPFKG